MKVEVGKRYIGKRANIKVEVEEVDKSVRRVTFKKLSFPGIRCTVSLADFITKYKPE